MPTNESLDARWVRTLGWLRAQGPGSFIATGWETTRPAPVFLDAARGCAVIPCDKETGEPWMLCTDDVELGRRGLPSYSGTLHRYLAVRAADGALRVAPATPEAPTNEHTTPLAGVVGPDLLPLNPEGGFVMIRPYLPLSLDQYAEVLSGGTWEGMKRERQTLDPVGFSPWLADAHHPGRLMQAAHGDAPILLETLHLKLVLLIDLFASVRSASAAMGRPLLSLGPSSFRVTFGWTGRGLPFLWTARAALTDAGDAVALPVPGADAEYHLPSGTQTVSLFRAPPADGCRRGTARLRVRKVQPGTPPRFAMECTFRPREEIRPRPRDLVWIRIHPGGLAVDLYGQVEADSALAAGEWRFLSFPMAFEPAVAAGLSAWEGMLFDEAPFELTPYLGPPCDLYSLAVLAIKVLVGGGGAMPGVALDELLSLGAASDAAEVTEEMRPAVIGQLFQRDPRWTKTLGPHHLSATSLAPEEALASLPEGLWFEVLAWILRVIPGACRDSCCRDFSDAPAGDAFRVFDAPLRELELIAEGTRSLLVMDWTDQMEMARVIEEMAAETERGG